MLGELLDDLLTSPSTGPCITATRHFAPRPPVLVPFPPSLDPRIADALRARGIHELYSHQAQSWELIEKGHRSEEHTSELQSPCNLVCRLLLEKKKKKDSKREDRRELEHKRGHQPWQV